MVTSPLSSQRPIDGSATWIGFSKTRTDGLAQLFDAFPYGNQFSESSSRIFYTVQVYYSLSKEYTVTIESI